MPSASICPPALVRSQFSWCIAGAHYKHWATSLGNFGVTPFFGGNFLIVFSGIGISSKFFFWFCHQTGSAPITLGTHTVWNKPLWYRQFDQIIGWNRILTLFLKSFNLVPGVPKFSWDLSLAPFITWYSPFLGKWDSTCSSECKSKSWMLGRF